MNVHDICRAPQGLTRWPTVRELSGRIATHASNAHKSSLVWRFSVRRRLAKSKTKEKTKAEPQSALALTVSLNKVGKPTRTEPQKARGQTGRDSLAKTERYGIMGTQRKTIAGSTKCSKHISGISDQMLFDKNWYGFD